VPAKKAAPPEFDRSHPVVLIHTNVGDIKLKLDADQAPGTVHNFLGYVTDGFYNGTTFHYVESGAMILGGGYTSKGERKKTGLPIRNEAHNELKNDRGTVAMARDPQVIDSATSQFFINLVPAPGWNHKGDSPAEYGYCVFGEVTDGLDVADKISKMPTQNLGGDLAKSPQPTVVIESIKLIQ
jgi:cyclophilin family peptidyl-prolyl cis-trans isomerase